VDRLLTVADAARILGVVPARVRQLANEGLLPPTATTVSGTRLFRKEDVEQLARVREAKRHQAAPAQGAHDGKEKNGDGDNAK
jgi:DNA-binding transcriptional MerR regulator